MRPSFETVHGGVAVIDPIERHSYVLSTPESVAPESIERERFRFPVDAAASIRTSAITLPSVVLTYVHNEDGMVLTQAEHFAAEELPPGEYTVELCAPVKLYLRVESAVALRADAERMTIDFGDVTDVAVGARSHHARPATTVTTTTDPEDMMQAVSVFASALKTTSVERSYPTLRGHPPTLAVGDELDLAGLSAPDTGVTIEVPPDYRHIFVVSSLAYYLGAHIVPGDEPLLCTSDGFEYSLEQYGEFERTVENTLKQVFFLDCLVRTEGFYPVDLHERRALESELDLDFAALYDDSLAERLEVYLSVPFETISAHLPEWKLTTHVEPTPQNAEMLPFVVSDLAIVRCSAPEAATNPALAVSDGGTVLAARSDDEFTRSTGAAVEVEGPFVRPEATESLESAWVGEGTPLGASKATPEAYKNRLDRTPADGDIDITVVCNDDSMGEERDLIDEIYGDRADLPFDVTVKHDLTMAELEGVLSTQTDFLHYVGHVDPTGFECVDGKLDARTLDSVGVDAFLLNACQSYQQGMSLIESGSIGGIVTLTDVLNCEAVKMGRTLARLLNCGFPLRAALEIARGESIMGDHYLVIGDGNFSITQTETGVAPLLTVERTGNTFALKARVYPTSDTGMGTMIIPYLTDAEYHVSTGTIQEDNLSQEELSDFLSLATMPTKVNGKLRWSTEIDVSSI